MGYETLLLGSVNSIMLLVCSAWWQSGLYEHDFILSAYANL